MITGLSQEVAQKSTTTCWPQKGVFANFSLTIEEKPQAQLIFRATTAGEYQVGIQYPGPDGSVAKADRSSLSAIKCRQPLPCRRFLLPSRQ